jgi:very-short-patch-repair endonuclease
MQKNDWYKNKSNLKVRRQTLRSTPTQAEYVLWQELRKEKLGYKFRRQFSINNFIVDFYCQDLKLIIEADGPIHEKQKPYDTFREEYLKNLGYLVLRFKNDEILFAREKVMQIIQKRCEALSKNLY